jgi:hypothetical protein
MWALDVRSQWSGPVCVCGGGGGYQVVVCQGRVYQLISFGLHGFRPQKCVLGPFFYKGLFIQIRIRLVSVGDPDPQLDPTEMSRCERKIH